MRIKVGIAIYQSRAIVAHHKILILLKSHFTIYKKRSIQCINGYAISDRLSWDSPFKWPVALDFWTLIFSWIDSPQDPSFNP